MRSLLRASRSRVWGSAGARSCFDDDDEDGCCCCAEDETLDRFLILNSRGPVGIAGGWSRSDLAFVFEFASAARRERSEDCRGLGERSRRGRLRWRSLWSRSRSRLRSRLRLLSRLEDRRLLSQSSPSCLLDDAPRAPAGDRLRCLCLVRSWLRSRLRFRPSSRLWLRLERCRFSPPRRSRCLESGVEWRDREPASTASVVASAASECLDRLRLLS